MSRHFGGGISQIGYVVRDLDAATEHWAGRLGVGPWFKVDPFPVRNFLYRGQPSASTWALALSYSGQVQIELIQPTNDEPSMYRDFLQAGHQGVQHLCYLPDHLEDCLRRAVESGYRIVQQGDTARGPFYYLDTEAHPGTVIELAGLTPERERVFRAIKKEAADWDGDDPVRAGFPTG